jgi:hypothetical protein
LALSLSRRPVNAIPKCFPKYKSRIGIFEPKKRGDCAYMRLVYQGARR